MLSKFVLEGWIRAKLASPRGFYGDPNQFYFDNHTDFSFGDKNKSTRVKFLEFTDDEENILFMITFGYYDIGIKFTVTTRREETEDRGLIFEASLSNAVKGYRKLKEHFLSEICPKSVETDFAWQSLLIVLYRYLQGLDTEQKNSLLKEMKSKLEKFASEVKFVLIDEGLKDYSDEREIRAVTMSELEARSRFDFDSILVVCEDIYLVVKHHLFATQFFLEDPTQSLTKIAEWGYISSLKLLDLHYEIKAFDKDITEARTSLKETNKKVFPTGLESQRVKLINLEKSRIIVEDELREFTNLSDKIYDGIRESEHSAKIFNVLNAVKSLPHSLYQAYGMLTMIELGKFSNFGRILGSLKSEFEILETKMKKVELYVTAIALLALSIVISSAIYLTRLEIGYLSDIIQILTFIVAIILLVIPLWPRH